MLTNNHQQVSDNNIEQLIQQISLQTNESPEFIQNYFLYFQNNLDLIYQSLITIPNEICNYLQMDNSQISLARRIFKDCSFQTDVLKNKLDIILYFMKETNLNQLFSYDCLEEFNWNIVDAINRVKELILQNQLPSHAFTHNTSVKTEQVKQENHSPSLPSVSSISYTNNNHSMSSVKNDHYSKPPSSSTPNNKIKLCQHPGCNQPISKGRIKYCELHGPKPLLINRMPIDYTKCSHPNCNEPVAKGNKKYCTLHSTKKK
ncbi:hypothetical protein ABK040_009400 [Willaertia magna]